MASDPSELTDVPGSFLHGRGGMMIHLYSVESIRDYMGDIKK